MVTLAIDKMDGKLAWVQKILAAAPSKSVLLSSPRFSSSSKINSYPFKTQSITKEGKFKE